MDSVTGQFQYGNGKGEIEKLSEKWAWEVQVYPMRVKNLSIIKCGSESDKKRKQYEVCMWWNGNLV